MSVFSRTITVNPWQAALERHRGRPSVELGAGRHRRPWRARHEYVDLRRQSGSLAVQEIPTADALTVKVSVTHTWHVADAVAFAERSAEPWTEVYLAIQVALRDALTGRTAEEVVTLPRVDLGSRVRAGVAGVAAAVGIVVDEVVVKDVVLPAEIRSAVAEVVVGRHRAQAQLEAARAQTAALRSLANGAKLLDDHPPWPGCGSSSRCPSAPRSRSSSARRARPAERRRRGDPSGARNHPFVVRHDVSHTGGPPGRPVRRRSHVRRDLDPELAGGRPGGST